MGRPAPRRSLSDRVLVLERESCVGAVSDRFDDGIEADEHVPTRLAGCGGDVDDDVLFEVLVAAPLPHLVGQRDEPILDGCAIVAPRSVGPGEAGDASIEAVVEEELATGDFVPAPRSAQFLRMQRLADVVRRRAIEDGLSIEPQRCPLRGQCLRERAGGVVYQAEVRDQTRGSVQNNDEVADGRRKRNEVQVSFECRRADDPINLAESPPTAPERAAIPSASSDPARDRRPRPRPQPVAAALPVAPLPSRWRRADRAGS